MGCDPTSIDAFKKPPFGIAFASSVLLVVINIVIVIWALKGQRGFLLTMVILQALLCIPYVFFAYTLTRRCETTLAYISSIMPLLMEIVFVITIGGMIVLFARGWKPTYITLKRVR